jgi:hypothetical protein
MCRDVCGGRRYRDDVASREAPRPSADEALLRCALTRSGPLPHYHRAGCELLSTVASRCGRTRRVRRTERAEGGRARPHRGRDRGGRGERPGQAARAPTSALLELATDAHPHAAVDVVSIGSQCRSVRVRHRRLRRAAGPGAGACSAGRRCRLLARAHRRSLPERRRCRCRHRNRLGPARRAVAVACSRPPTRPRGATELCR